MARESLPRHIVGTFMLPTHQSSRKLTKIQNESKPIIFLMKIHTVISNENFKRNSTIIPLFILGVSVSVSIGTRWKLQHRRMLFVQTLFHWVSRRPSLIYFAIEKRETKQFLFYGKFNFSFNVFKFHQFCDINIKRYCRIVVDDNVYFQIKWWANKMEGCSLLHSSQWFLEYNRINRLSSFAYRIHVAVDTVLLLDSFYLIFHKFFLPH